MTWYSPCRSCHHHDHRHIFGNVFQCGNAGPVVLVDDHARGLIDKPMRTRALTESMSDSSKETILSRTDVYGRGLTPWFVSDVEKAEGLAANTTTESISRFDRARATMLGS